MNKFGIRLAACALAGTVAAGGYQMTLEAKLSRTSNVPAAGVAVVLDDGSTIEELQAEVIDNIAYLESVSGIKPNTVIASEQVALAENGFSDIVNENGKASSGSKLDMNAESETDESESVEAKSTKSASDKKSGKAEQTQEDADAEPRTSVGFSALDTYEAYNTETKEEASEEETSEEEKEENKEKEDEQDFSNLVIAQVNNYVNVRSMPSEEGEIVGKLYDKSVGEFIEEENGWYKITSGKCTGYVKGEYCVTGKEAEKLAKEVGTTYAVVNTTTLKVRKDAGTDASVLGLVPMGEELIVVSELDGWVQISIEEGDGYVSRDYVKLRTDFVHAESKEEEEARLAKEAKAREEARAAAAAAQAARAELQAQKRADNQATIEAAQNTVAASSGSESGKAVIDYALQFVGNPYVYGGSSLTNGTDCSGFVMSVYSNFGVSLPHSSTALRSQGYDVGGVANAQPGDIICYSGHVGLYIGNGQIVHASTSKTGIIVSNVSYRNVLSVRRIF